MASIENPPHDHAVARSVAVGVVVPVVVTAIAVTVQLAIRADLPDPVASHWGSEGVDGASSFAMVPWLTALVTLVLPIGLGLTAVPALRKGERSPALAFCAAGAAGLSVFMAVMLTGSLWMQRGLDDWTQAPGIGAWIGWGMLAGVVAGAIGWWAQPRGSTIRRTLPATEIDLRAGETAVWIGRISMGRAILAVLWASAALVSAIAVAMWVWADDATAAWVATGAALLVLVLVPLATSFSVRVDARGLEVASWTRLLRFRVPLDQVRAAQPIVVSGIAHFGGYGIRVVPGATAVVLRSGPALEVERTTGRRFVVTVDDPATPAALLSSISGARRADQG